jgi:uncharacterized membrane protein
VTGDKGQCLIYRSRIWLSPLIADICCLQVFVAFFIKLGLAISYCQVYVDELESTVLISAAFIFLMFFFLRLELDTYANLFHSSDVVSRIQYFLFMMGIGSMAISMPGDGEVLNVPICQS